MTGWCSQSSGESLLLLSSSRDRSRSIFSLELFGNVPGESSRTVEDDVDRDAFVVSETIIWFANVLCVAGWLIGGVEFRECLTVFPRVWRVL